MLDFSAIPLVDQHAHPLLRPEEVNAAVYLSAFTEAADAEMIARHTPETLFFRRSLREIAEVLGCAPDLPSVLAERERLGFDETARRFLTASNIGTLLLDDGFQPDRTLPVAWHTQFACVYRLLRIEHLAEELIADTADLADFSEQFRAVLDDLPADVVGLKSIVAYRTGLAVAPADDNEAAICFITLRLLALVGKPVRLDFKPLNDWVVRTALEAAARRGMPVQFHTGFGDPDLDLRDTNPLHLRPLLEDPALRDVPFVLLHAGYPYTREAGYLAAVYPNVFVDLGLSIPSLSVAGMTSMVRAALELAPTSKLLFSSDAHVI
ncbi:MAG: amidohydrolase family protein, partial [Chloroflexi bacterium]|nr:amidohydrolase family protein [Chloroflexota bacterium]